MTRTAFFLQRQPPSDSHSFADYCTKKSFAVQQLLAEEIVAAGFLVRRRVYMTERSYRQMSNHRYADDLHRSDRAF
jgi:hypothetical protein